MSSKLYLLVCEGMTDILVIDEIAKKISTSSNDTIEIRELSPQKDATTNRYPSHGWEEVKRWCKLYGTTNNPTDTSLEAFVARRKNWKAKLAISKANGLIIQIDTDIVQYITDLIPIYSGSTKNEKKRFITRAILHWLGEDTLPQEIFLLLSTDSTETWILATHNRIEEVFNDLEDDFDFENIQNVVERLFQLGYTSYIDTVSGRQKLSKNKPRYTKYARKIANNLEKVCLECKEADKLYKHLTH